MKNIVHMIEDKDIEWVQMAKNMIRNQLKSGLQKNEKRYWTAAEALILLPSGQAKKTEALNMMLKNWLKIRRFLRRGGAEQELPVTLSVRQLGQMAHLYAEGDNIWAHKVIKIILALGCTEAVVRRRCGCRQEYARDVTQSWKPQTILIDYVLSTENLRNGKLKVLCTYLQQTWREGNQLTFRGTRSCMPIKGILKLATAEMKAEAKLYRRETTAEWSRNHKWLVAKVESETCSDGNEVVDESDDSSSNTWNHMYICSRDVIQQEQDSIVEQRSSVPTDSRTCRLRAAPRQEEEGQSTLQVTEVTGMETAGDTEERPGERRCVSQADTQDNRQEEVADTTL
ncbi:hypothetical protein R1sor_022426 [Riccia sorocarpa]|uniref:Uncharacterized protein n=1 Tax=Riccia sorocarpa TaxID=122646 RepID=A0ABD3GJT1_9MARC